LIILINVKKDEKNQVRPVVCLSHAVKNLDSGQQEKGKTLMI